MAIYRKIQQDEITGKWAYYEDNLFGGKDKILGDQEFNTEVEAEIFAKQYSEDMSDILESKWKNQKVDFCRKGFPGNLICTCEECTEHMRKKIEINN